MNVEIVFAVPLSWSVRVHYNLAPGGYIESSCCCVQASFLCKETKILYPLSWYIQRYLISVELIFK
jgi:hypothetical protein